MRLSKMILALGLGTMLAISSFSNAVAATDIFSSYKELAAEYKEGEDYVVETHSKPKSDTIILAIHGGKIEPGTDQITRKIAKKDYSYYILEAKVSKDTNKDGRNDLHLTSTKFDEPRAIKMTAQHNKVVTIHGAAGEDQIVYLGGRNGNLKKNIASALKKAGFKSEDAPAHLDGSSQKNIVNKGRNLKGVQLELTRGLRNELMNDEEKMDKFAKAIREAVAASKTHPDGRTFDFNINNFSKSVWLNGKKAFYLTSDDVIRGVQSPINPDQTGKVRFDFYNKSGKLVLSKSAQAVGHKWFIHTTGLKTGYYTIKVVNPSGNPIWVYGGLRY